MCIRSLARRITTGVLLTVVVFGGGPAGFAAVWDQSCGKVISSLQGTQHRIQLMRGKLAARDMRTVSSSFLVGDEKTAPRFSESEHLSMEQEMRRLLETFNVNLKEFTEACLKDHAA